MNKNFMYGVGAVKYKDFVVGYIEKNSFDMGGQKPESAKIEAEQVPGTPVLIIPQSNGSIAPTFNVIQLNYENLHSLLGGTMHYKEEDSEKKTPIGWTAPTASRVADRSVGNSPCFGAEHPDSQWHATFQSRRQADPDRNGENRMHAGSGHAGRRLPAPWRIQYGFYPGRVETV